VVGDGLEFVSTESCINVLSIYLSVTLLLICSSKNISILWEAVPLQGTPSPVTHH
jgi:Na+-translocating ferredoxin:NAD+ oxidoreductase RnfE subunit